MTDTRAAATSVTERTRALQTGASVVGVHFLKSTPVFVLGEEALLFAPDEGERRVAIHGGAILSSACDGKRIVTGGDDGRVVATDGEAVHRLIAADAKRRWIDHVALGPDGAVVWSTARTATVRTAKSSKNLGEERSLEAPSSVGGLAFAPKGFRLAVAHYNGVSLWFPNAKAAAQQLEWKGSHLGVAFSPDGRFLVTAMQEPALHGWRLADGQHMRMSGYSARVRSLGWTADGDFLATAGSEQLILWPFQGKDGPIGMQPKLLAPAKTRIGVVACHPKQPVVAAGYADGMVLLVRIDDGAEIVAKRPGAGPVTALGWDAAGAFLAFGTEAGEAGIVSLR